MGTVSPFENYTVFISPTGSTSGTTIFSDEKYDYNYYRMVVSGAQGELVTVRINGQEITLAGTTSFDAPIYSLEVTDGAGVILFGTRSVREIFGN